MIQRQNSGTSRLEFRQSPPYWGCIFVYRESAMAFLSSRNAGSIILDDTGIEINGPYHAKTRQRELPG